MANNVDIPDLLADDFVRKRHGISGDGKAA